MIGDGLYETEVCNSCNKQHRVASVHTQCCCKTRQTCTLPSILSKTTSVLSSSTDILPSILKDNAAIKAETVPFSREFCREMLSQEESVLTERLLFERKLLEEAERYLYVHTTTNSGVTIIFRKHQMLELEEARYGLSQQKELEEEKETFEQAKKRRLALETILKTLNDIPVSSPKYAPIMHQLYNRNPQFLNKDSRSQNTQEEVVSCVTITQQLQEKLFVSRAVQMIQRLSLITQEPIPPFQST